MNAKSLAVAFSAILSFAAFAPQAEARDRHRDDDRHERYEHRDRRHSDRDHHRSYDRYQSSRRHHHHSYERRYEDRRHHHHRSHRDVALSFFFGV